MKKRVVSALLSVLVCISALPLQMFAFAEDTYCPFSGGSGTEDDPYQISTAYDLRLLSELVNDSDTTDEYKSCYYIQTEDIDLGDEPFIPIATYIDENTRFNFFGYYDGNYKEISGLYVEKSTTYNGLFGRCHGGTIKNLSVYGNVSSSNGTQCGGIVGEIGGSFQYIKNCNFIGDVSGAHAVGGIVGFYWVNGTVENCFFNGSVTCTSPSNGGCGGIVGTIVNGNPNNPSEVGEANVKNCYAVGTTSSPVQEECGGIVGKIEVYGTSAQFIQNNYYLHTMADTGINGDVTTGTMKMAETAIKACADMLGSPFVDNCETDGFNDGYPIFEWQSTPYQFKGSGTAEDPYLISSKDELKKMCDLINSAYFTNQYNTCYYVQNADIDLENELWKPIGIGRVDGVYDTNPLCLKAFTMVKGITSTILLPIAHRKHKDYSDISEIQKQW